MGSNNVCPDIMIFYSQYDGVVCIPDPPDSELQAAFEQFSREKSGSGLSAAEQLVRLNVWFPQLNIK
jgi:hypothetical protein